MTLAEFLLARIAEDEAHAAGIEGLWIDDRGRVLAECEAKRRIVELHKSWPVLAETQPTFERVDNSDLNSFAMQASERLAWLTEQEYRSRFGDEPPTAPMLAALAAVYADHPDFQEDWRP